jgi:hypothetical protein
MPWFFRLRSTMAPRPTLAFNGVGPATQYFNYLSSTAHWGTGLSYDANAGGGYDIRGIPLPVHLTGKMRLLYPKLTARSWTSGGNTPDATAFSTELIVEVPTVGDNDATYSFWGPALSDGDLPNNHFAAYGFVVTITTAGVCSVRFATTSSLTLNTVRVSTNLPPGSLVHLVCTYAENQTAKIYVNGSRAASGNLSGLGQLCLSALDGGAGWATAMLPDNYNGNPRRALSCITNLLMHGGPGVGYNSSGTDGTRQTTGVGWLAVYPYDLSTDPDAGGQPISIRDLYETYANNAVWTGGSRPNGWPTTPQFSGYAIEVAADAPNAWMRLQEINKDTKAVGFGFNHSDMSGYYSGTGCTFAQTGMTNGMQSVNFGSNGVLRVFGDINTSALPNSVVYNGRGCVSAVGSFECWYRPTALSLAEQALIHTTDRTASSSSLYVYVNTAGKVNVRFRDSGAVYQTFTFAGATALQAGTAYHLAVTWDSLQTNKLKLYINGVLAQEQNLFLTFYLPMSDVGFSIGNLMTDPDSAIPYNGTVSASTKYANGDMQDVALYSYALSADRIAAHYAARNN